MGWIISTNPVIDKTIRDITDELGRKYMDIKDYKKLKSGVESTIKTIDTIKYMLSKLPYNWEVNNIIEELDRVLEESNKDLLVINTKIKKLEDEVEEHGVILE